MNLNINIQAFHSEGKKKIFVHGSVTVTTETEHPYLTIRAVQSSPTAIDLDLNFEQLEDPAITKGLLKLIPIVEIADATGVQTQVNIYHVDNCIATVDIRPEQIFSIQI